MIAWARAIVARLRIGLALHGNGADSADAPVSAAQAASNKDPECQVMMNYDSEDEDAGKDEAEQEAAHKKAKVDFMARYARVQCSVALASVVWHSIA